MDTVTMSRSLFGVSMAFHIIFATLGVGIPTMIVFAELLFQRKKDPDYSLMAKRWTKAQAILLGVAIPSGTIVGTMLALLWPGFMKIVGQVIALPFQIELWAFFLEALFMSIYVYAADRLPPGMRIVSVTLVAVGAAMSAVLITDAQAWMNTPRGFKYENGRVFDVHPWQAVFNPSFFPAALHVVLSAWMTGAFAVASIAAFKLLWRSNTDRERAYHMKGLKIALWVGFISSALTAVNGHENAQILYTHQPERLAAAEGLFETRAYAPLVVGGIVSREGRVIKYGIEIPGALSFLAGNSFKTVVHGLNEVPKEDWPPLFVHSLFDLMVGIGMFLLAVSFVGLIYPKIRKRPIPKWLLCGTLVTGPLSMLGIESGWVFSCSSRQPWTIYHIQRTVEASTKNGNVGLLFFLFVSIYVFLLVITAYVMRFYFKRHPVANDLTSGGT